MQLRSRQTTSPLKAVLCFGNHTCPFNMYFQYINGRPVTLIHQPTQCSLAGLIGRVGVTFPRWHDVLFVPGMGRMAGGTTSGEKRCCFDGPLCSHE
jgi:hypothetical protein